MTTLLASVLGGGGYPVWGRAGSPRSGRCVSVPPAGSWGGSGPERRGAELSGAPAAPPQGESPANGRCSVAQYSSA